MRIYLHVEKIEKTYTAAGVAEKLATMMNERAKPEIIRTIRHYAGVALLMPIGAVNTGTGNKRLYPRDAIVRAAVLLWLNRLGIPVGVLRELFAKFEHYLMKKFKTNDLIDICKSLSNPYMFLIVPQDGDPKTKDYVIVGEVDEFNELLARPLVSIPLLRAYLLSTETKP
jgi:DNA-binding transcriptional MerR regulator